MRVKFNTDEASPTPPEGSPHPEGAVTVYLDLNHWYALGDAAHGSPRSARDVAVLDQLRQLVAEEKVVLPLSAIHYMELIENPRDDQRAHAAAVMSELSRFRTLAPGHRVLAEELDLALHERFGRPAFPERVAKFGTGIGFALGRNLSLSIVDATEDELRELETRVGMSVASWEQQLTLLAEHALLVGPVGSLRADLAGYDPYAARRIADEHLASFNVMVNTLRTDPTCAIRPLDLIVAREFIFDFLDLWTRAQIKAGFSKNRRPFSSKEEFTDFLMSLPSRRVSALAEFHYLQDLHRDWTINDLRDIAALSIAIPYCDVVITDKKAWDMAVNRAHLDTEFDTIVLCRLSDLPPVLP